MMTTASVLRMTEGTGMNGFFGLIESLASKGQSKRAYKAIAATGMPEEEAFILVDYVDWMAGQEQTMGWTYSTWACAFVLDNHPTWRDVDWKGASLRI